MNHHQVILLSCALALLIFFSMFFSAAETSLMAINRYRLRHKARMKKRSAILILKLLKRPDRLLGMILIGNTVSNLLASAIATLLAVHFWGDKAVVVATFLLAVIILVFAEVAPKTVAVLYPDRMARLVALPVTILLKFFYPLVMAINVMANGLLYLFRIKVTGSVVEPLSREELRSIVYETSGRQSHQYQNMLLGILDLNKVAVDDVMVPQHQIVGIDLNWEWEAIQYALTKSPYDWLPVYRDHINQIVGMLHLRELMHGALIEGVMNKELLSKMVHEPYFVPEHTPLNTQLLNFQHAHKETALVVDEYGEIVGLITLADILEEIVGEFAADGTISKSIQKQTDGSYLVEGSITLRELNRLTQWQLPTQGQRTVNGLIVEYLESIPHAGTCILIDGYPVEIMFVEENRVQQARIFPRIYASKEAIE